jgi:hypothetical protein
MVLIRDAVTSADIIDVSTSSTNNWLITGAGAASAPAMYVASINPPISDLSITSNTLQSGTFAAGGSLATFNGFWYADLSFSLPSNATAVTLVFSDLNGDDRAVLELNNTVIGDTFLKTAPGAGVMSFPPGPPDAPFFFTGHTAGTVTSGFVTGLNELRLVVNNTDSNALTAPTLSFGSSSDGTAVGFLGTVSYTTATPLPTSWITGLVLLGILGAVSVHRNGEHFSTKCLCDAS